MPFSFRRQFRLGARTRLHVSKSGVSVSHRREVHGFPVTVNTRRGITVNLSRLVKGLIYRKQL
jgi:hypothetical protein